MRKPAWLLIAGALITVLGGLAYSIPQKTGLSGSGPVVRGTPDDPHRDPREAHLFHVKQLTFGGTNAEAYFSPDGKGSFSSPRVTPTSAIKCSS